MEFQITEASELVKTLAETENLTHTEALTAFFYEADMSIEDAAALKAAFFEDYTLKEMAEDTLSNAFKAVFVTGIEDIHEVDTKETGEGTKYKVRVKDRSSNSSYTRYATRQKIAELRANPNIASVELTDHGDTGEDDRGERTAAAKRGDRDGDGTVESGSKEHAGVVHNAIQRKMGGRPDGQDTRREEFGLDEGKKEADLDKMKRQSNKHMKDAVGKRTKSDSDSKNKSFKMDGIRSSIERGEDPRRDTYGGKRTGKDGTHPPEDHRSSFTHSMKDRPAKDPGVKKEGYDQGYNDRLDDALGSKNGKKSQSMKDRRDESEGMEKKDGKNKYAGDKEMDDESCKIVKKESAWESYLALRENRRAARAAGGYKDDSKKQTDPSKDGFTGISGSIKDIMKQSASMDKAKKKVDEEWKPDPKEKRERKSAKLYRDEKLEDGKRSRDRDPDKVKDLYKRRMAVDFKKKKSSIGEDVVLEGDLINAGSENQGERERKKLTGKGVDNKPFIKIMPTMGEAVVTDSQESRAQSRLRQQPVSEGLRDQIKNLVAEECCPKCGTPECVCEGKKEEKPRKKKAKLDEAGMPILEYSRNDSAGPSKEMIDPPKDPEGKPGVMNPKGKPKRYKNGGEAPGDRRPNAPGGPELPFDDGTVPNGAGV